MPTHVTVSATDNFPTAEVVFGGEPGSLQVPPVFPFEIAATQDLLSWSNAFPNQPIPTLSADVGMTDTTLNLTAGNGAQLPGDNFEVSIDDEIIFVRLRSGDSLTQCIRGAEGSSIENHFTGANVQLLITAASHNQVVSELVAIEQILGASGGHVFPKQISLAPSGPGNFSVAHGLGVFPRFAIIQMTSGGGIWFQSILFDGTNLNLVASDAGVTGIALVWS